jgi:F0F1-type ATP synthase assembly protein I
MSDEDRTDAGASPAGSRSGVAEYLNMGTSIAIGTALGLVFGTMLGQLTWGLIIGAALGVLLGAIVQAGRQQR